MSFTRISTDLQSANKLLLSKQIFDYIPEMNAILNSLHKRIFNLEIALQANNQMLNRSHTMINDDLLNHKRNTVITQQQFSQKLEHNSIDTLSQRSVHNSLIPDQRSLNILLDKQFHKLNLASHISFDQTIINNIETSDSLLHTDNSKPSSLTQMKTRAYEFAAIFEDTFDQLNIIHKTLSINNFNRNNNQCQLDNTDSNNINSFSSVSDNTNCNPFALNLAGIFIMNERDKLCYEIEYFFHILLLLFRALLLENQTDFQISTNNMHNHLPSIQLIELNNRLKISQDKLTNLLFIKKNFQKEKFQQLNILNLTKSQLKDHVIEEQYRSKIALNYCNNWKKNHILQWIEMLLQIEENYIKTIHQYENILKQTDITHKELIKILIKQNNELKFNVDKWYDYYQNETDRFEKELISFRQEFNHIKQQRQNILEECQKMKVIIDEYNQMKINEKILLEKQLQQEQAIKRIQAWWRGTMSRHIKQKRRKKNKK